MNDIITIKKEQFVISSLDVANLFGREHRSVLRSINQMIESNSKMLDSMGGAHSDVLALKYVNNLNDVILQMKQSYKNMFIKTSYQDQQGKRRPMFVMNKDGFLNLVNNFTDEKAKAIRFLVINEFNRLEAERNEREITVRISKRIRRSLTDVIKEYYPECELKPYLYSLVTNYIYKQMFGLDAPQIRELLHLKKGENVRPHLNNKAREMIADTENYIAGMIKRGKLYEDIKKEVPKMGLDVLNYLENLKQITA